MARRKSVNLSPPETSLIKVIDTDPSRMVIYIPCGGEQTRGIGCFTLAWNGFMTVFTAGILIGNDSEDPSIWILSVFWVVGLWILLLWIRMRFTRSYLMLEQDRLLIQRILFGYKSIRETILSPESRASLVEAYQQNDDPVFVVAVKGVDRTAKFGTPLSLEEKQWFVRTINRFLKRRDKPKST